MSKEIESKRKLYLALAINILIVIMEIIGVFLSIRRHGLKAFQFYTEISNYFSLIVSLFFIIYCMLALRNNAPLPQWVILLRFISSTCLTITFLVVIFVLIPMMPDTLIEMLFEDSNLYQHTLCPILSVISLIFFENNTTLTKKFVLYALLPTMVYGVTFLILNICKVIIGPYPFFYVYEIPWYASIIFLSIILLGSILVAFALYRIYNRGKKRKITIEI